MQKKLNYNADIDGLRAIAVIAVVLFHSGVPLFSYGYLGVDVFFVISGYLITNYISDKYKLNNFGLLEFYEKRMRRIAPALLVIMFITIPFAWIFLLPDHFENYGQSLVATVLYANNILLYLTSNYWDHRSELKPMLHTWSLGVEVQFYIFYPIILLALMKLLNSAKLSVGFLVALLVVFACISTEFSDEKKFYLLQFRFYEFMFGGFVAVFFDKKIRVNWIVYFGLCLVMASMINVFDADFTQDARKISSLIGASLIIAFSNDDPENFSLIGWRGISGIGVISYSIYLIHQPIFAFMRVISPVELNYYYLMFAIPGVVVVSFFSWKYIEVPYRSGEYISGRKFFKIVAVASTGLLIFGCWLHFSGGVASRFKLNKMNNLGDISIDYNEKIRRLRKNPLSQEKSNVLIIGDSFSRDFANVLIEAKAIEIENILYFDFNLDDCNKVEDLKNILSTRDFDHVYIAYQKFIAKCHQEIMSVFSEKNISNALFIGPKSFGENINFLSIVPENEWVKARANISYAAIDVDQKLKNIINKNNYVSLIDVINYGDMKTAVTDARGNLISLDGEHLTKFGAIYMACMLNRAGLDLKIHTKFQAKKEICQIQTDTSITN